MKKIFTFILSVVVAYGITVAKPIDPAAAKIAGQNFITFFGSAKIKGRTHTLDLVYTVNSKAHSGLDIATPVNYFYVFNIDQTQGFVIVSADDDVFPVLAYSDEAGFNPDNIGPTTAKWLEGYKNEIRYVITNHIAATKEITTEWAGLLSGTPNSTIESASVNPLLQTKWDQAPYYNTLCPYDNASSQRTVTGCVATAMAQIMKFWNYPETGTGFHSYNHSKYGTLSANFSSTTYQWGSMPNTVGSSNSAVATLMYHCGVSVDMNYDIGANGGSGAYVITAQSPVQHCSEYALKTYFGYKNTLKGEQRVNYTQSQWINLLKGELNNARPILYAGFGSGGGHCFVADGYDNNDFFHFNWGWSGNSDGYFNINALNPAALGAGGGNGGFNSGQQAVIGIEPPTGGGSQAYNLEISDDVTPSATNIAYGNPFYISVNIINNGTGSFTGDYSAGIFDKSGVFIEYVQILADVTLPAGYTYTNGIKFSSPGSLTVLPGSYDVFIFSRPTGGEWKQLTSTSGFIDDYTSINILNPSNIELNSAMVVTPGTLIKGQPASVNLNVANASASTFLGTYQVSLYNLDGSFVQNIGVYNETNGLPSGYTYQSPYITFSTASITAEPGTYLLAIQHKTNSGNWTLTGSTNFQNPIKVTVKMPAIQPDAYENNNTVGTAYNLPISFSGNTATKTTTGSNCHVGSDYDYYKINLPAGYNYTVTARIHDLYSSTTGPYTLDALFSYSTNGTSWSDAFDDVMPGSISMVGGGTVYFLVSPYFTGATGTYLLDIKVTRISTAGIEEEITQTIQLYPNPAHDFAMLDANDLPGSIHHIQLMNIQGQKVNTTFTQTADRQYRIETGHLAAGCYILQVATTDGVLNRKIIVE